MALIKCADCGRDISTEAPNCPACGKPVPKKKTSAAVIIVSILAIAYVFGAINRKNPNTAPSTPDLSASAFFTGTQFVIANKDAFDWTDCEIEINPHVFGSGFTLKNARIAAHETVSVGALQFANSEGERFDPLRFKPTGIGIRCMIPAGRASFYGNW